MSERAEVAERIAAKIREWKLNSPFGGDVERHTPKYYGVLFSYPRFLDGLVRVYSPTWILIEAQGPWAQGGYQNAFSREKDVLDFIYFAFVEQDWVLAEGIPVKPRKEKKS